MSAIRTPSALWAELPEISRHDRARYVGLARRLRAEQLDRLFAAAGRRLARLGHAMMSPIERIRLTMTRTS